MLQAAGLASGEQRSHCSPSRNDYSRQQLLEMRLQATRMAISLKSCGDEDMMRAAITSSDYRHRVAAAFALGMTHKHDENLMMLMEDQHPLVVQAAREACTHVSAIKFKQPTADFGPFPGADASNRTDSVALWRLYFDKQQAKATLQSAKAPKPAPQPNADNVASPLGFVNHPTGGADPVAAKIPLRQITYDDDDTIPGFRIRRTVSTPDLSK